MTVMNTSRAEMGYCPGCSHAAVLEHLGRAIDRLGLPSERVCLVTDIGCIGIADRYFDCHTFHGLHGRSITYAEGIKRVRPELLVVVLIGDGGCGIGTAHLVHAARRNADIKVIVCNNFNFGMTGGQHSPTTPECTLTTTTPHGAVERPFDICETVAANGAAHVARRSALDERCSEHLAAALRTPGFALVDLWELCVAYFVPANELKPRGLTEMSQRLGLPFGVVCDHGAGAVPPRAAAGATAVTPAARRLAPSLRWRGRTEIVVAGAAGQRIRSAVGTIGELAVAGGLHAAQLDDFPITVRRGHSISSLIVSDSPIRYCGVDEPSLVVLLAPEGRQRLGPLSELPASCRVLAPSELELPPTPALVQRFSLRDMEKACGRASAALAVVAGALAGGGWIAAATLRQAAEAVVTGRYRDESLKAIAAGIECIHRAEQVPAAGS